MPKFRSEAFQGGGDYRWLRSDHAIWNGRSEKLDLSAFTSGTHYPNGYIPSGTPVALTGSDPNAMLVPYDSTEGVTTNAGVLAGHILHDVPISSGQTEDPNVALLDHGRVNPDFVPVGVQTFVPPVAALKRVAAQSIVYR